MSVDINIECVENFMVNLEEIRKDFEGSGWKSYVEKDDELKHWRYFLSNDPYTRWGMLKPRGYPGDATLMDFAYRHPSIEKYLNNASSLGKALYNYTSGAKQSKSARIRTKFISDEIKKISETSSNIKIASFAIGHGRELENLSNNDIDNISEFLAIDSDFISLNEISGWDCVKCVNKNVFRISFKNDKSYDLVYSLGLFDYLDDRYAINLLNRMWRGVKPGGKLLIANLNNEAANLGYCGAIMDWWMIPRSEDGLSMLANNINDIKVTNTIEIKTLGCFSYLIITSS
ncbi:MAG: methyltransferase domain-containing protein [Gammaproteobacteria bacterium]|nr:methyltransferase domain-containing protein [Gammaproteobacteria bacterium]